MVQTPTKSRGVGGIGSRLTSRQVSPSGSIAHGQGLVSPSGSIAHGQGLGSPSAGSLSSPVVSLSQEEKNKQKYSKLPPALRPLEHLLLQADASAIYTKEAKKKKGEEKPRGARGGSDFMRLAYEYEERNVEDFQLRQWLLNAVVAQQQAIMKVRHCSYTLHIPFLLSTHLHYQHIFTISTLRTRPEHNLSCYYHRSFDSNDCSLSLFPFLVPFPCSLFYRPVIHFPVCTSSLTKTRTSRLPRTRTRTRTRKRVRTKKRARRVV